MKSVAAILLAAGRSERMGAFKPLLHFGDTTVIRSCISTLSAVGIETIVVVIGHRGEEIRAHLSDLNVVFALNEHPDSEMTASIACGVAALPANSDAVLIALTDHPAITASVIRTLIEEWKTGKTLLIPETNRRGGHPVLIDGSFREQLLHLDPKRGLKSLFEAHPSEVHRIPVDCAYIARDIDTWDDYLLLHQEIFGKPPAFEATRQRKKEPKRQPN